MTGYGRGQSSGDAGRVSVEIRSVNHRFLDLKLRGAPLPPAVEAKLRKFLGKKLSRGSVSVTVRVDKRLGTAVQQIDLDAASRVHTQLQSLNAHLGRTGEIPLSLICNQPGVIVSADLDCEANEMPEELFLSATQSAVQELCAMRQIEGTTLQQDMLQRLRKLGTLATSLRSLVATASAEGQRRLADRIEVLLKNTTIEVDDGRMAQEVALIADRLDVSEELVRIASHLEQLEVLFEKTTPVGRRLDFLVQELGREFNTVTSKSQSSNIALLVVEAKAEMEKIREQVQNIE